jgi:WhiB family transcriptional regulator, redox-sensing transcriptional regulator
MDAATQRAARQPTRLASQPGNWRDLALCAQTDPESFFPEKGESVRPAKRVCAACEVRAECLQDALDRGERFGVWGGLSERERRALARQPNPTRYCPAHGGELSGGPVLWHCPAGRLGHGVTAADLETAAETRRDAA